MASKTTSGADDLRAAAASLDLIQQAKTAAAVAQEHLDEVVRQTLLATPRMVTVEQVAEALGVSRRHVYNLLH